MKRFNPLKPTAPSAEPMTAPRKAPQTPGATEFTVTLTENRQKDGLELRFPSRPDDSVLADLKMNHWRWSRFSSCWYTRNTPENRTFASRYLKTAPDTTVAPTGPIVAPESVIVPQTPQTVAQASAAPETVAASNLVRVDFGPEIAFTAIPRPAGGPLPLWKRTLLRG